jgi:hypothetical protein
MATFPKFAMNDERLSRFMEVIVNLEDYETEAFCENFFLEEDDYGIVELLEDIQESCCYKSRECDYLPTRTEDGKLFHLIVTGGMTWGDPPTEMFNGVERAGYFTQVWDLAVEFAVEDIKNHNN